MTHFGIICPPYPGHLHPLSALGRELQGRGHRVTILHISDLEAKIRSEGLEYYPIGQTSYQLVHWRPVSSSSPSSAKLKRCATR